MTYKDRYLMAEDDRVTITHGGDRSAKNAVWVVEFVEEKESIRLRSCFGTYLTASSIPFLPGVTGKKVIQSWPFQCEPTTEWEPLRDGMQVRLRSVYGYFLRPNGGLPPWRNSITHDIPHRSKTKEKVLWDVEVVEKRCHAHHKSQPLIIRSRSFSGSKKQRLLDDEIAEERFSNVKYCCWYPKACMPF
ncbi:hypothetical protein ACS0TY_029597 [Phlomoides rotata]